MFMGATWEHKSQRGNAPGRRFCRCSRVKCEERVEAEGMVYAEFLKTMKKAKRRPSERWLLKRGARCGQPHARFFTIHGLLR